MYENTSEQFNNIIEEPGRTFKARLINGTDIISDVRSVSITQSCNNEEKIGLGGGVSAYIDVVISNISFSLENVEYELQIGLKISGEEYEYVPMGLFTPKNPIIGSEVTRFVAYGRLYSSLSKGYFSEIETYPIDAKQILAEIERMTGVPIVMDNLPDGIMVNMRSVINENTVDDDGNPIENTTYEKPFNGYTYRETLCYIAQLYGKCVVEDRIGQIIFKWFSETDISVDRNQYKDNMQQSESEFFLSTIHCSTGSETLIAGGGYSGIAIDNPVMTQERLNKVYQLIGGFHCKGIELDMIGNICIDVMDILSIQVSTESVKMPIVRLITTFDGGISQKAYCYGGSEEIEEVEGPTAERMDRIYNELLLVKEVMAYKVSVDSLNAQVAKLGYANIKELSVEVAKMGLVTIEQANVNFIKADMSNFTIANIQTLFIESGIIKDATIKDGHITGQLDSVTVNANSITTGTLSVDRLVIRGSEKSLVYELNNISGALQAKSVDTLNGEILTQRTITADKLIAKSITSNEIKAETITSDEIAAGTIKAANINVTDLVGNSAFINSLKSNTVIVGLQNDINGISVGGRNLLIYSQLKLGSLESGNIVNVNYRVVTNNKIPVEPGEQYILKVSNYWKYKGIRYGIHSYNANGNFVNDSGWIQSVGNNPYVFTTRDDTTSIRIVISFSETTTSPTTTPVTENRNAVDLETWKNNVKIKLEKGNRATDWTPAPEDVDGLISAAQSTADSANTLAGTANSAAGAAQTTANTALTTANNAKKIVYAKAAGGGNSAGYFKLCTITTNVVYQNTDIVIGCVNRGFGKQTARIHFNAEKDAIADRFTLDAISGDWYIHKSATYTWDVYVQKYEPHGWLQVDEVMNFTQFHIKWVCENANLPSGATKATRTVAMGTWCYNNDITYINGGKLYTGTVTADKLAANSVTADKILAGAITADKLSVDAITSRNYVKDTSGTKISLADGSYDSKYTKINSEGKISCQSAEIKGRLSCYGDLELVGGDYQSDGTFVENGKRVEVCTYGSKLGHMLTMGKYDDYLNVIAYDFRACNGAPGEVEEGISLRALDSSLTTLSNKVYTTDSGLFNTAKALFINGVALSSKWAQLIIEYNGSCFGIRNDGGNTYLMNGNTNGWTNYCSFNTNGNWGFPGNATLPGTLTAGSLFSTGGLCLAGRTNAQTTAKPNAYIDSAGNVWKSSTTSSKRFKEDVKPVENMELNPENLYDIDVVQFKYKKGHFTNKEDPRYRKDMIGFIAENVYEHYPMAVDYHIGDDGNVVCDGWNEQYLIPAMLKLIQDQHMQLINQEMKIKMLEDKVMFM